MRFHLVLGLAVAFLLALGACEEHTKLEVTGLEPNTGTFEGGTRVKIKGHRFTKDGALKATVYFGKGGVEHMKSADVLGFQGDETLLVKTPGGEIGEKVDVLIIFEGGKKPGEITLKDAFTYVDPKKADVKDLDIKEEKK
jgi:hypothetical protein